MAAPPSRASRVSGAGCYATALIMPFNYEADCWYKRLTLNLGFMIFGFMISKHSASQTFCSKPNKIRSQDDNYRISVKNAGELLSSKISLTHINLPLSGRAAVNLGC